MSGPSFSTPPSRRTPISVVIPSLLGGGAERVAIDLANHWSEQARDVTLISIDRADESHYSIRPEIRRIGLNLMVSSKSLWSAVQNNRARIRELRRVLVDAKAKAVVSFTDITNVTTLLACRGMELRTIVAERTDPRHHRIGRVWSWLRRRTYGNANTLVVQTEAVRGWAQSCGWQCPIAVIPNAVLESQSPIVRQEHQPPMIVGMGRLSEEKGFDLLIPFFAMATEGRRFRDWQLTIYGEGPERQRLEQLIPEFKLTGRVHLPGWIEDTTKAWATADLFVLPSRYEGFPNVLLEAMAAGVPCVSFDCDSGPREIIRDGIDGMLVPTKKPMQLVWTITELLKDSEKRMQLGIRAREVVTRFSRAAFYERWDAVLDG
jgi:GalNAc-alpha-(1->4)-GalNAc-alpha-(1->3)-diNAcBac-PP-undecaprenol alpha-1,4-N-acetyl-D-galactosaminyltransferase